MTQFFKVNKEHFTVYFTVKFHIQQLDSHFLLTKNRPILNPYLPQKSENLRPHSSNSLENATPS